MTSHAGSALFGTATLVGFAWMVTMWTGMMTAMMAPVAWPWMRALGGLLAPAATTAAHLAAATSFASGYLTAWLGYATAAAGVQLMLAITGVLDAHGAVPGLPGAVILVSAGVFQLTPFKRACLTHCRSPLSFLLRRWQSGPPSPYRIGIEHGLYCVGCCWALMATMLAVGMTSVTWMAALTAAVFIEQVVPSGDRLRIPLGVALVTAGILH